MTDPFQRLGLAHDADATQVKRAYARLLRTHRPDEDPEGFQRLHEAYQACLRQVQWRQQADLEPEDDEAVDGIDLQVVHVEGTQVEAVDQPAFAQALAGTLEQAPDDAPATPAVQDAFDAGAFAADLVARMQSESAREVQAWLDTHEALYSLERKHGLQPWVVDALDAVAPEVVARHYAAVTAFFGLDTVGIDGWLRHMLDVIQGRSGDFAEFERVLRAHAGAGAKWTDRLLAAELLKPFLWLRRLFLIVFPGLPGRMGALVRALQTADPQAAEARLDADALRFWTRATARDALRWERVVSMAIRIALWATCLGMLLSLADAGERPEESRLPIVLLYALPFGLWLVYSLAVAGLIRFRDYNAKRLQWDPVLLFGAAGLTCGVVATCLGASGAIPFIATLILWIGARSDKEGGISEGQGASFAAGFSGFAMLLLALYTLFRGDIAVRYMIAISVVYTFAVQAANDALLARKRGISLPRARLQAGWLWRLAILHGCVLAALVGYWMLAQPAIG